MPDTPEIVPLTADEKDWLMSVFTQRKNDLFYMGYVRCIVITAGYSILFLGFAAFVHDVFSGTVWLSGDALLSWLWLKILLVIMVATGISALSYFYWMVPFRDDALSGVKQRKPFVVIAKEYFSGTDQYFVKINNELDDHYEVSEEVYNNCEVGGVIMMDQAIKSGFIFSESNHERVKQFQLFTQRGYNAYRDDVGGWGV